MQPDRHIDRHAIEQRCRSVIDGHAQRDLIRSDDLSFWVREVVAMHGELAVWHAVRAGGFGGSEIGVLVRNYEGQRADHQASAHDIVASKLLRKLPDEDNGHLRRGHGNEERHGEWFRAKYSAVRDQEAFDKLRNCAGPRPWMRYSPDELVLIPASAANPALGNRPLVRVLADYKAPSRVDETSQEISFQYACQLHQGALICAHNGIHLDGLMLSQFDWAGWQLRDDAVPYDAELARQIVRAGDHYWEHVLRGEVPAYVTRPVFEREQELAQEWAERANRLAQMLAMSKALQEQIDAIAVPMKEELAKYRMSGTRMRIGELSLNAIAKLDHAAVDQAIEHAQPDAYEQTVKSLLKKGASPSYDAEAMARQLKSMGVALKPFAKNKFDDARVYEWSRSQGLDPDAFLVEEIRMSPSEGLRQEADRLVRATFVAPAQAQADAEERLPSQPAQTPGDGEHGHPGPGSPGCAGQVSPAGNESKDAPPMEAEENGRAGIDSERYAPRPQHA